jgi:ResB-like family protein
MPTPLKRIIDVFSSLRLTVVCLMIGMVLVFVGTLAQVHEGLYQAQTRYFKSLFIWWSPGNGDFRIPVFPGGYLVGGVLLINLLAAHIKRFELSRKKIGIFIIHSGLILLLMGQLFTDLFSTESALQFTEGQSKTYSEDFHANELVLIDESDANHDRVVAVPERLIASKKEVALPSSPFSLRVKNYWQNTDLLKESAGGAVPSEATQGIGRGVFVQPKPPTAKMDERNLPAAVLEVLAGGKSLGNWLISPLLRKQTFTHEGKEYEIGFRFTRHYMPFSLGLIDAEHSFYTGTDIPNNYSSRVRVENPRSGENREVLIKMNEPLRYAGLTFFQFQMSTNMVGPKSSTLQVVRNPSWRTPYISCLVVAAGLLIQFLSHLFGFIRKRTA